MGMNTGKLTRFLHISPIAAPYHVKLAKKMRQYCDCQFWFYEQLTPGRPAWWAMELPDYCRVLKSIDFFRRQKYVVPNLWRELNKFNPDVLLLYGVNIPSNYIAYRWARKHYKAVALFSETMRLNNKLRKRDWVIRVGEFLYRDIDLVFGSSQDSVVQLREMYPSWRDRIIESKYPADLDSYFSHSLRKEKKAYVYFFPNRLIDIYNPLLAIEIFAELLQEYPGSTLKMNSDGELRDACNSLIDKLNIRHAVEFISEKVKTWDDMPRLYEECDIMIFPAKFSNGNFTILEAMASGMGIIITDNILGYAVQFIKNNHSGFICDVSKKSFIQAVKKYIGQPRLFKQHAEINRKQVRSETCAAIAELHWRQLQELMSKHSGK